MNLNTKKEIKPPSLPLPVGPDHSLVAARQRFESTHPPSEGRLQAAIVPPREEGEDESPCTD